MSPVPDEIPQLYFELCELAQAEGVVPEDGSGIDGIWTTSVRARDRDRDWNVAMNADLDDELEAEDFPRDSMSTSVEPAMAVLHLGAMPVGVIGPGGGQIAGEIEVGEFRSAEDEFTEDVQEQRERLEEVTDGGE